MKKSAIFISAAALIALAVGASALSLNRTAQASGMPKVESIAPTPASADSSTTLKLIGSLVSANQVSLAFQLGGKVSTIPVKEGDKVSAGETLASLDTSTIALQIAQAQAALDAANATLQNTKAGPTVDDAALAKSNLDRAKATLDQAQAAYDHIGGDSNPFASSSPQVLALQQAYSGYQGAVASFNLAVNHPTATELELAQAQAAQAQAALNLAKQSAVNSQIVAPFDGTVLWIGPDVGEFVSPGAPALTLADLSHMQAQVGLDENSLPLVKLGESATITLDALPGKTLTGKVSKVGILATTTAGIVSIPVTLDIDPTDAAIYPGLSATVEIATQP
jgi:multidrug resistance efflux pump